MNNVKEEITFDGLMEFCDYINSKDKDLFVSIVAKYDVMKEIFRTLYTNYNVSIRCIEKFGDYDITGYNDEYLMEIMGNNLYLYPYKTNGNNTNPDYEYLLTDCDKMYVHGDCSSKILRQNIDAVIIPFLIANIDGIKCECKKKEHCKKKEEHNKCKEKKEDTSFRRFIVHFDRSSMDEDLLKMMLIRKILF